MPNPGAPCEECGKPSIRAPYSFIYEFNDRTENAKGPLVYFIEVMTMGRRMTKIGFTSGRIFDRVKGLQTATPGRLVIRGWVRGNQNVEAALHDAASNEWTHAHGEWFDSTDKPDAMDKYLSGLGYACEHDVYDRAGEECELEVDRMWSRHVVGSDVDECHANPSQSIYR